MKNILITDYVTPPFSIEKSVFGENFQLVNYSDDLLDDVKESIKGILVWHKKVDKKFLAEFPNCEFVVRYGVGYEDIDLDACKKRGISFSNTPDYGTEEVADTAVAMVLNLTRGVSIYDYQCKYHVDGWQEHINLNIRRSNQLNVGILGCGRIGTATMQRLKPFGFKIYGYDPYVPSGHEKAVGYNRVNDLDEIITISDIISVHVTQTDETKGFINKKFVSRMRKGSFLVNTARGPLIDSFDTIEYGLENQLAGVALDVQPHEPPDLNKGIMQKWRRMESELQGRLIINPHTAFYSQQAWHEMRYKAAETMRLYFEKGIIRNRIA